jgi:hypothetical protein
MHTIVVVGICTLITWALVSVLNKTALKTSDPRIIAPISSAAVALLAYWTGFMNPSIAILAGIAMGPASGVLHDKLLSPLFIEQVKKDIADVEKKV